MTNLTGRGANWKRLYVPADGSLECDALALRPSASSSPSPHPILVCTGRISRLVAGVGHAQRPLAFSNSRSAAILYVECRLCLRRPSGTWRVRTGG